MLYQIVGWLSLTENNKKKMKKIDILYLSSCLWHICMFQWYDCGGIVGDQDKTLKSVERAESKDFDNHTIAECCRYHGAARPRGLRRCGL